jgi:hypothetical protein
MARAYLSVRWWITGSEKSTLRPISVIRMIRKIAVFHVTGRGMEQPNKQSVFNTCCGCHAALNSRIDGPYCSVLSAFLLQSYFPQITDICTQIADDVHDEVCPRFECKSGTMKDGWRGNLGRSAAQGSYDSSLSRTPRLSSEHPRSGESPPLSSTLSAIPVQTCP